ncbi:hypothetical protein GCM10027436_35800 [Actinophytocola sediminis]
MPDAPQPAADSEPASTSPVESPALAGKPAPDTALPHDANLLALPLPPAPPGERGYRPGDVERLMTMLITAATDPDGPRADDIATLKLSRTFFIGQGYHAGAIEALRLAWVSELRRREL